MHHFLTFSFFLLLNRGCNLTAICQASETFFRGPDIQVFCDSVKLFWLIDKVKQILLFNNCLLSKWQKCKAIKNANGTCDAVSRSQLAISDLQ